MICEKKQFLRCPICWLGTFWLRHGRSQSACLPTCYWSVECILAGRKIGGEL